MLLHDAVLMEFDMCPGVFAATAVQAVVSSCVVWGIASGRHGSQHDIGNTHQGGSW